MTQCSTSQPDQPAPAEKPFKKARYRRLVADLFTPDPRIYWADFLLSLAGFIGGLAAWLFAPAVGFQVLGFGVAVISAYRCASMIHEIVHLPTERFGGFIRSWNILFGMPFLMPSFLYETHLEHHLPRKYGTAQDPEYLPLAGSTIAGIAWFLAHHALVTPVILFVRLLIGLPVRLLSTKASDWLDRRLTALVINWRFDRRNKAALGQVIAMETHVLALTILVTLAVLKGWVEPVLLAKLAAVPATSLLLNGLRTLAAHRYANTDLGSVDMQTQLLDSLNYTGPRWIGYLMAPIGLRHHALHHLFPTIPYHSLQEAHDRIMADIAPDDVYARSNFTSYTRQILSVTRPAQGALAPLGSADKAVEAA